jgi:hypothetical protein
VKDRRTKGAIKLHLLLDRDVYLPSFTVVSEGKTSEIKVDLDPRKQGRKEASQPPTPNILSGIVTILP